MKRSHRNAGIYINRMLRCAVSLIAALSVLLCNPMLLSAVSETSNGYEMPDLDATDAEFVTAISTLRSRALVYAGVRSFNGYCAWYVNIQLLLLGINRTYVGGNGNDEFGNYCNLTKTTGGYRVRAYPEDDYTLKSALEAIVAAADGKPVRNVLAGFSKAGGAGEKYGHTFFIHLIRDGSVFFSDSYGIRVGGKYYPEGSVIKCTIDELFACYNPRSFVFDGVILFEEDDGQTPEPAVGVDAPAVCRVDAEGGLRVRSGPGTGYAHLALIADGSTVWVTEISADGRWGRVFYGGKDGWSSLEYMKKTGELPAVIYDIYNGGEHTERAGFETLDEAAGEAARRLAAGDDGTEVRLLLTDTPGGGDVTLPAGVVLDCGAFGAGGTTLRVDGGAVISDKALQALEDDPFVASENIGGRISYTSAFDISVRSASLVIADNVAIRFGADASDRTGSGNGIEYSLVYTVGDGETEESPLSSVGDNGYLYFMTEGLPPKKMADTVRAYVRATAMSGGVTYERFSGEVSYSVTQYAANMYGGGEGEERRKLDRLLSAMLNYGSEAQSYFDYNTENPAKLALPEDGQALPEFPEDELWRRAAEAPDVDYSSRAHITSASLDLKDKVGIRMRATGLEDGSSYRLLVWSGAEYAALVSGGDAGALLTMDNCKTVLTHTDGVFELDGIPAKKLADTYYFRLCETDADGSVSYDRVLSYSVTTYCANKASGNDGLAALCRSIAVYSAAAREYFDYTIDGQ